jgi:hypothetical protein
VREPLPAPPLLARIDEINPRWIDQVLARSGLHVPAVTSIQVEPVGHGTASTVVRLTLSYAGDPGSAPPTLIAKFPKVSPTGEAPDAQLLGYEREVLAYRFFGVTQSCRLPKCYFADIRADGVFNLILEELSANCWPGNQITGCSIEEAGAVVDSLAGLHAAYCDAPGLQDLRWPKRRRHLADQSSRLFTRGATVMRERYIDQLGATALATIDDVAPLVGPWSATTSTPETLIHTDARVDNIIFEQTPQGIRACLIDLQSMAIGASAHDLAYFLSGSLEPEDRAKCERELVSTHAAILIAAGAKMDGATAWERYRQHAIAGLIATVSAAAILPSSPAIDRLLVALARRNCASVQELDGIEAARSYIN